MRLSSIVMAVAAGSLWAGAASAEVVFRDDFDRFLLGPDWTVSHGESGIRLENGFLRLEGLPYHKRADSVAAFAPPADGAVTLRARLKLGGDYQKLAFNIGWGLHVFYFDTLEAAYGGEADHVHALVQTTSNVLLLDQKVPVTWGEFHDFAISWTPTQVVFFIDGVRVASLCHTFAAPAFEAPLSAVVWNDRAQLMEADWVEVSRARYW